MAPPRGHDSRKVRETTRMIHVLGSGALNLDIIYEVDDLAPLRKAGFSLEPGHETSGDHEEAKRLMEHLSRVGTLVARSGGGSAANTLCALDSLGWKGAFCGFLGKDAAGDFIASSMGKVDISLVARNGKSALCVVVIERAHRDRALFVAPRVTDSPNGLEKITGLSAGRSRILLAPHLHLSSLVEDEGLAFHEELVLGLASEQTLSVDPGEIYAARGLKALSGILSRTDILFVTAHEISILTGLGPQEGARNLLPFLRGEPAGLELHRVTGGPVLVCKEGAHGASLFSRFVETHVPAERIEAVVDNTGAGDAFNAGFIHKALLGGDGRECLETACRIAALSLSAFGRGWLSKLEGLKEKILFEART